MREYDIIEGHRDAGGTAPFRRETDNGYVRPRMKRIGLLAAIIGVGTVLAGCTKQLAEAPPVDPLVACVSYESVLATVNDVLSSGQLSDEQVVAFGGRVVQVSVVVEPLCTGTMPETNSAAAQRILAGLSSLVAIHEEVQ